MNKNIAKSKLKLLHRILFINLQKDMKKKEKKPKNLTIFSQVEF